MELYQFGILAVLGFFGYLAYKFYFEKPMQPIKTKSVTPHRRNGGNNIPGMVEGFKHNNRKNKR